MFCFVFVYTYKKRLYYTLTALFFTKKTPQGGLFFNFGGWRKEIAVKEKSVQMFRFVFVYTYKKQIFQGVKFYFAL